jgi:hypothetical protein
MNKIPNNQNYKIFWFSLLTNISNARIFLWTITKNKNDFNSSFLKSDKRYNEEKESVMQENQDILNTIPKSKLII